MQRALRLILTFSILITNIAIALSHDEAQVRLDMEVPHPALISNNITVSPGPTVQLSNGGIVRGLRCPTTYVNQYLGIPFALAPLGPLRFASPQPYKFNHTFNISATKPPPPALNSTPSAASPNPGPKTACSSTYGHPYPQHAPRHSP